MGILQLTEHFSEVRKYSKVATILFICFTTLVVFKVTNPKQILLQPSQANLKLFAPNISVGRLGKIGQNITVSETAGERNNATKAASPSNNSPVSHEQNLYEELASLFDKDSCLSRYQHSSYRKNHPYKPSPYLVSKLRAYQELHSRCAPHTSSYKQVIGKLSKSSSSNCNDTTLCKYLVWTPANGLGNRMVSITSAFVYALLKSRVLLVEFDSEMDELFCEPFPKSTWLLPDNFPHRHHWTNLPSLKSRGHSPIVHLNLQYSNDNSFIGHFYCNDTQSLLEPVPVVILRSDQYFTPSLFLIPLYKEELNRMFPEKGSVFHLLVHYLFNPSNKAWGLITRFYEAYLSKAGEKIGLQIRAFYNFKKKKTLAFAIKEHSYEKIMTQILACTLNNHILPLVATNKSLSQNAPSKSKSILVSSLYPEFSERLRNMYWIRPTLTGDVIGVYQPSHEEYQKSGDNTHNMKAWAEMYLLSLCDVLVTSGQSTFGYVAQGLGGVKPWILDKIDGMNDRNPSCKRGISSEPCFHVGLKNDCNGEKVGNVTAANPHFRVCEDMWRGVKLVDA